MPITEKMLSYEDMTKAIRDYRCCGQCGKLLTIAWGRSLGYDGYVLRCPDPNHDTMRAIAKKSSDRLEGEKIFRRIHTLKGMELDKLTEPQMLERVSMARFPQDLTKPQSLMIAKIAIEYGLDPLMGELLIYQGSLYVPLTARLRKAQETEKFDGINTRPATEEEKKGRGYGEGDYLFLAEVWRIGSSRPFQGWAGVKAQEIFKAEAQAKSHQKDPYSLPITKDSAQHAEKRAIARALRMAFHLPLPSAEDIGGEENGGEPGSGVKGGTSIIDGEVVSSTIDNKASKKGKPKDSIQEPEPEPENESPETEGQQAIEGFLGEPKTIQEFLEWVTSHGKDYNRTWVLTSCSLSEADLPNQFVDAYYHILSMTEWDPR